MKPSERINRTYTLRRETVEVLLQADDPVQVPVQVDLVLSPNPHVVLGWELPWTNTSVGLLNGIHAEGEAVVRLSNGRTLDVLPGGDELLGGRKIRSSLVPQSDVVTVLEESSPVVRCKFALVNFPNVWGEQDIHRPHPTDPQMGLIYPRFSMEVGGWSVDLTAVDGLMGAHHYLTRRGGSILSHIGSITRTTGSEFSLESLSGLLGKLHLFLSFARGGYCGLTLLHGYDANRRRVWEQWGTYRVEPWRRELVTWAVPDHSHALGGVFAGLWNQIGDVEQAIRWYLRSNESNEAEVSVVLTHAALEYLAFKTVGKRKTGTREKEGDWIARALIHRGIDPALPVYCHELGLSQLVENWSHGPHALVSIRNDLIHAERRRGHLSKAALVEARNLGLHYVELMLLALAGYTGEYVNRLKTRPSDGVRFENVPWAM